MQRGKDPAMAGGMLEGVKVVDLSSVVIGPLRTQILADHGAEVIKVEGLEGDIGRWLSGGGRNNGMGPKFLHLNRNKRSICLNLKHPEGHAALLRLIESADVMTWNVRPASMRRLRLSYQDVQKVNPAIICCGMFGFGQGGPYAGVPAYDPIIQGISGVAALHERAFGEPRYVPYVLADRTTGLIAVQMVAMALYHRERTGRGQSIEVPMFENMASQVLTEHLFNRTFVPPIGEAGDPRLLNSFYGPSHKSDGYVNISANTDIQVFGLMAEMGHDALRSDPRFSTVTARFTNVHAYTRCAPKGYASKLRRIGSPCARVWISRRRRTTPRNRSWPTLTAPRSGCCAKWSIRARAVLWTSRPPTNSRAARAATGSLRHGWESIPKSAFVMPDSPRWRSGSSSHKAPPRERRLPGPEKSIVRDIQNVGVSGIRRFGCRKGRPAHLAGYHEQTRSTQCDERRNGPGHA